MGTRSICGTTHEFRGYYSTTNYSLTKHNPHKSFTLLDPHTGTWDMKLIKDIFWEEDVQDILSILIKHGREDTIAWHYDPKGRFSVKSAYHVLEDSREQSQHMQLGSSSSSLAPHNDFNWLQIWRLPCAPNIKHFI